MAEPTTTTPPAATAHPLPREALNSATVRGAAAVTVGTLVLLLPDLTLTVLEIGVAVVALVSGVHDLWYALTGRRRGKRRPSRWRALVRAPLSLLLVYVIIRQPDLALTFVVGIVGLYIGVRGLLLLAEVLLRRTSEDRRLRAAIGMAAVAVGVQAWFSPETLSAGVIAGGAVLAIVIGSIVLVSGVRAYRRGEGDDMADRPVVDILWDEIRSADIGEARRSDLSETLYFEPPELNAKLRAWWVMLALSVAIATFAVLQDSTAVVIGAMLIAPLMVPILGLAGALVNGWGRRATSSAALLTAGVLASVALSYGLSAWAPVVVALDTNTQVTSRVSPSLPDMLIAVAAGAAGAFATVTVRVASSIAGVAIAVALVPPLAVVGISLGAHRYDDAGGAMLLFLTNSVAIVLAAAAVFAVSGFARPSELRERLWSILATLAPFVALAALIILPLVFTSEGLIASSTAQREASEVVDDWLGPDPTLDVTSIDVQEDVVAVSLTGPTAAPPLAPLREALTDRLDRPVGVTVTVVPVTVTQLGPDGAGAGDSTRTWTPAVD